MAATPIASRHQHSYLTMAKHIQAILREFLDFLEINRPPLAAPCPAAPCHAGTPRIREKADFFQKNCLELLGETVLSSAGDGLTIQRSHERRNHVRFHGEPEELAGLHQLTVQSCSTLYAPSLRRHCPPKPPIKVPGSANACAWRLQAAAEDELSQRACARAALLACRTLFGALASARQTPPLLSKRLQRRN